MKQRSIIILTAIIVAVLVSSLLLTTNIFSLPSAQASSPDFYVGVQLGYGDLTDCMNLVDKVKNYTNLFVISSNTIIKNETCLNLACDYIFDAGLSFYIFYSYMESTYQNYYNPLVWLLEAKERYCSQFLGAYYGDEPGGKQLDGSNNRFVYSALDFQDAASQYVNALNTANTGLDDYAYICNYSGSSILTSDYGLYWFDYKSGYDVVLAQLGWNHSRPLQVAMCRGAAEVQGKTWGVIVTWEYSTFPYIESGEALYDDLVFSYDSGAKYAVVFNYAGDNVPNPFEYGILEEEHFDALQRFWRYVQTNSDKPRVSPSDVAFVLPQDYGFGFRRVDDTVWGIGKPDQWTEKIWEDVNSLLVQYGSRLDLVYTDSKFSSIIQSRYGQVLSWSSGAESGNFPVINLNNTMGYSSIQQAIDSYTTFSGHTLLVKPGTYYENVVVDKSLSIISEDKTATIIDGGANGTAFTLSEDVLSHGSGTMLSGFTIRNCDGPNVSAGILLSGASNCKISENIITQNKNGIFIQDAMNNTLRNNEMHNNEYNFGVSGTEESHYLQDIDTSNTIDGKPIVYWVGKNSQVVPSNAAYVALVNCTGITAQGLSLSSNYNGLLLVSTSDSTITNNYVGNNYEGIKLQGSTHNLLQNNDITNNFYNFFVEKGFANNIDTSNTINSKPIYYWVAEQSKTVPVDAGYIALVNCKDITVQNIRLTNNGQGLLLVDTADSTIKNNTLTNNRNGIVLVGASSNTILQNEVTDNENGITLSKSSKNNYITENTLIRNSNFGVSLNESSENVLYKNTLTSNSGGIYAIFSNGTQIKENNISSNELYGIWIEASSDGTILENNITNNGQEVKPINLDGTIIHLNLNYGGIIFSSNYNTETFAIKNNTNIQVIGNNILNNNQAGMIFNGYNYNISVYHNSFNNTVQVSMSYIPDVFSSHWDDGTKGNYWSDYSGTDRNNDGIGETPYKISDSYPFYATTIEDTKPLIEPFAP